MAREKFPGRWRVRVLARLFFGSLCAGVVRRFSPLSVAMKFEVARARGAVQRAGTERPLTRSRDRKHRRQVLEPGLQGPVEKNKHRAARVFPAAGLPCGIFLSHSLNQRDWQRQSDNARREREREREVDREESLGRQRFNPRLSVPLARINWMLSAVGTR